MTMRVAIDLLPSFLVKRMTLLAVEISETLASPFFVLTLVSLVIVASRVISPSSLMRIEPPLTLSTVPDAGSEVSDLLGTLVSVVLIVVVASFLPLSYPTL